MRVVTAVIGVSGALFGILKSIVVVLLAVSIMFSIDFAILPIDLAMIGTEVVAALFCVAGLVGTGLLLVREDRRGLYLMLAAAIGVAVAVTVQPFLVSALGNLGIPERFTEDASIPGAEYWAVVLVPTLALLLASVLGTVAIKPRQQRSQA